MEQEEIEYDPDDPGHERDINMDKCSKCKGILNYFSGLESIPAGLYCFECNDAIYNEEGNMLCLLE